MTKCGMVRISCSLETTCFSAVSFMLFFHKDQKDLSAWFTGPVLDKIPEQGGHWLPPEEQLKSVQQSL